MILFLDTVSPLPEFSLIEDNKIIFSKEIIPNPNEKMSDFIVSAYINIEKKYFLSKNLEYLLINTGPGSYTALRIGIAFLSGLSISLNINFKGISCVDLFNYSLEEKNLLSTAFYIKSSNNQNFYCFFDSKKKIYNINKVEKNLENFLVGTNNLNTILTNINLNEEEIIVLNSFKCHKLKFNNLVCKNINTILSLPEQSLVEPIYTSNNKILN